MVDCVIEAEIGMDVGVGVDHLEVCPGLSIAEMLPLDQRNDCQVSGLAPDCPLCQQTNVPVRCWDTKIEIFIEILRHLTFIERDCLFLLLLTHPSLVVIGNCLLGNWGAALFLIYHDFLFDRN